MWSEEAEKAVLGAILTEPQVLDEIALSAEDFHAEKHREIFRSLRQMHAAGEGIDPLTLTEYMGKAAELVGGAPYLIELTHLHATVATARVEEYARIIRQKRLSRDLLAVGKLIVNVSQEKEFEEAVSAAEKAIHDVSALHDSCGLVHLGGVMMEHWEDIQQAPRQAGLSTGLRSLDLALGGLHPSDLVILAGRPGQGKSALALQVAHAVARDGGTVGVFSMEMSARQIAERLVAGTAGIDTRRVRLRRVPEAEWPGIWQTVAQLSPLQIWVDDAGLLKPSELLSRARRLKAKHGLDLIIVDYLQLMDSDTRKDGRQQEVTEISRRLKAIARDMDVPVLACAQLSRAVEQRANKEPELSDLRESGAIEQDADVVAFIHRTSQDLTARTFPTDILVKKNRHGPVGMCALMFVSERVMFTEVQREQESKGRDWCG